MTSSAQSTDSEFHPEGNDKLLAVLCHISPLIGVGLLLPLIVYIVTRKENAYVSGNAATALNFHISCLIYSIIAGFLIFILIGIPLLFLIGIASFIFAIIGAIKSSEGRIYKYPLAIPFLS